MNSDINTILDKALATAKKKDTFETEVREVEEKIAFIGAETERLKGIVHHHRHHRKGARLPVAIAVFVGALIMLIVFHSSGIFYDGYESVIPACLMVTPGFIVPGVLLSTFFASECKHKKLAVIREAELAAHEEAAPRFLAEHQSRLDDLTNKAKAFWAEEKENLAMFPAEHKNLNSVTVIAEYARNLNIDNINTAIAFGELVLTNRALSADVQKIYEELGLINNSIDKLKSDTEAAKRSGNSIWGAVILHTVLESIFDS